MDFGDWSEDDKNYAKQTHDLYVEHRLFVSRNLTILSANEFKQTAKTYL